MELPPKDDASGDSRADSEASEPKKTRLSRGRGPKAKPKASAKAAAEARAPEPEPAREPVREAPPERREAPEPPPQSRAEPAPAPQQQAPQSSQDDGRAEQSNQGGPGAQGGYPENQNQGGGQGQWDDRGGGGGGDRGFWKRNKRKRGRHGGGHWQPGGGGGQGGGQPHSPHPPQPPPPSPQPIYGDLPNPARFDDLEALKNLATEIASGKGEPVYLDQLYALSLADLTAFAKKYGVTFEGAPNRRTLLAQVLSLAAESKRPILDRGYIDLNDRGAFIVHEHVNYRLYPEDAYLPESLIRLYGLKRGHRVEVLIQAPQGNERCPAVVRVDKVMGGDPDEISKVTPFEELIPYYPLKRILLESEVTSKDVSMRAVDILTPIGFGQRGLIVAPPRTGKTVLLQNIANSVTENSPHAKLILLLIDERPEEVTDFRRHTKGEVVSSTFDETPESHVHCAEMVIEKARRMVEQGEHVIILLDSITRLARAYNALTGNQGKTMSGGLESNALQKPKRFFGSARNIEGGGSLTIIASALIDTGSRMDEIIFEEFKGTGNSELHLDRGLVERRIFPAINIDRSGTRKEELIYHPDELQRIYGLRRAMQGLGPIESMEMLITRLKKTKSNAEFLMGLKS